mgnify:CR=1 FL=1
MNLSLTDLSILIELTEKELTDLHSVINNENADEELRDANAEYSVQVGNTAGILKAQYKSLWSPDCNFQSYEDLIKEIESSNNT